jgi:putative MFS transporter
MNGNTKQNSSSDTATDILGWVEGLPFGRFHIVLLLLTSLPVLFAGYCTQIVAFVIPSLLNEWGLSPIKAGALASWGFAGFMLGSLFLGAAADRVGRKKMLLASFILCSVSTGLCYYITSFNILCLNRLCTGLGVGGIFPLSITIVSEFTPSTLRARLLTVVAGSYTLGWVVAALVSIVLLPIFSWRTVCRRALPHLLLPFRLLSARIDTLSFGMHTFLRFFMKVPLIPSLISQKNRA